MSLPLHPSFCAASPVSPITRTFPHTLPTIPWPIVQAFQPGRQERNEICFLCCADPQSLLTHPLLFYLLHDGSEINHLPRRARCVFMRLSVCTSRSDEWGLLPSGDSCFVVSTARGLPPCFFEWMCVLLMPLAVTCTHCYQHDLCFPLSTEYFQCSTHLAVLAFFIPLDPGCFLVGDRSWMCTFWSVSVSAFQSKPYLLPPVFGISEPAPRSCRGLSFWPIFICH